MNATPILLELLLEQHPHSEPRRIFGLGQQSDFGPSPAVAEVLGHRARRDVHRPILNPALRAHREEFRPLPLLPAPTEVRGEIIAAWAEATGATIVHDPGALVAETASASQGLDTSTITLPAVAARLRAFATGRFAHQPLGPGAPTVVESAPVE